MADPYKCCAHCEHPEAWDHGGPCPYGCDDDDYLTPAEFAALPSTAQHAVWKAHAEKRVQAIPVSAGIPNGIRRYHREQVEALLAELETEG